MIKVYFENGKTAELVAVFEHEKTYLLCLPGLLKFAEEKDSFITETVEDESIENLVK